MWRPSWSCGLSTHRRGQTLPEVRKTYHAVVNQSRPSSPTGYTTSSCSKLGVLRCGGRGSGQASTKSARTASFTLDLTFSMPFSDSSDKRALDSDQESQQKHIRISTPDELDSRQIPELVPLLDLTHLSTETDISRRFEHIASALLHGYDLCLAQSAEKSVSYRLLEIEFYLRKDACHEDPFAHASEEQAASGTWYFHRSPRRSEDSSRSMTSTTGYRGGTRKGLDLAFGGPVASSYFGGSTSSPRVSTRGGVLFRSIRRVADSTVISGPSLLVDEILRSSDAGSIPILVQDKWAGDTSSLSPRTFYPHLYLKRRTRAEITSSHIYTSPRIGLDLSHPGTIASVTHPRVKFIGKPYRHFIHPELLTANGRTQTFVGILLHLYRSRGNNSLRQSQPPSSGRDSRTYEESALLSGINLATVKKYLEDYETGYASGTVVGFVGPAGKGVSGSPSKYLRMMGVLERLYGGSSSTEQI